MPRSIYTAIVLVVGVVSFGNVSHSESLDATEKRASTTEPGDTDTTVKPSLDAARQQAAILHETIHSALRVTHDRYYVEDEGLPIPAAVLKEVFADIKKTQGVSLRWLTVEGQAMNTDHKPQDDFELQAVKALKAGEKLYEETEPGIYRRVGPITLSNHCLKCHVPDRRSTRDRTAGLIISIPVGL